MTKLSSEFEKIAPFWVVVLFSFVFFQVGNKTDRPRSYVHISHILYDAFHSQNGDRD